MNLEDLKKKYKRDNRELYHEAIKHNHRKMSDSGKLYGGYEILVQKVFESDLSRRLFALKFDTPRSLGIALLRHHIGWSQT